MLRRYLSVLRALLLITLMVTALSAVAADNPLQAQRWRSRPLVLVAPTPDDPSVQTLNRTLAQPQMRAAFADRQIVVVTIIGGQGDMAGVALRPEETRAILAAFGLRADGPATTLLIGKDGGVKLREANIHPEQILATIDTMPMRRDEVRKLEADGIGKK